MRIILIGTSPYLLTSSGKLHSRIIKDLYLKKHEIAVIAHNYDTSFFVPEESKEFLRYCYKFSDNNIEYSVPLFPYARQKNQAEAIQIYELLEKLKPDLVITVDDFEEMYFMQAIKMFLPELKWLWVLTNGSIPINEQGLGVAEYADSILCTNNFTYKQLSKNNLIDWCYVGADLSVYSRIKKQKENNLSLFCSSKNSFKECPPVVIEACKKASKNIILSLYLHTNTNDNGFYNFGELDRIYDNLPYFVSYPEPGVSVNYGHSETEMNELLNKNHIYISNSMSSSTSMGVFEALAAGCLPLVNKQGCDEEIINRLKDFVGEKENNIIEYFMYDSLPFLTMGEKYINIPKADSMVEKILKLDEFVKNKESYRRILRNISEFIKGYSSNNFINRTEELILETVQKKKTFSL